MKLTKAITYAVLKDKAPKKDYEEYSYLLIERILTDSIIGTTIYDKKTKQPHYMAEENEIVKDYYENGVYLSRRKTDKPYIENYGSFKMNENKPIFVNEESEGYIQLPIKTERATIEEEVAYKRLEEEYYGTTFANYLEEVKSRCNRRR